jgi:hypothetical protein
MARGKCATAILAVPRHGQDAHGTLECRATARRGEAGRNLRVRLKAKTRAERPRPQEVARLAERLLKLGRECARLPMLDKRTTEEMLYDENGLPK